MANSHLLAEGSRCPWAWMSDPEGELAEPYARDARGVVVLAWLPLQKRMQNVL